MRILVTGSAGFLGGYIVNELLGRGHEVSVAAGLTLRRLLVPGHFHQE